MTTDPTEAARSDVAAAAMAQVPAGFAPMPMGGEFIAANGPFYLLHHEAAGGVVVKLGFRVEARHCNPMGICHGGMLASFCDMLLPISVHRKSAEVGRRFLPTVSLQLDYMSPAPLGAWIEGEAEVLKVTRAMVFAQGLVHAGGKAAVRCSGVFKIGPPFGDDAPLRSPQP
jgi:uncharacterized protein (TIGR00369 family)